MLVPGIIDTNGNFTLTLSATIPETVIDVFKSTESGIEVSPEGFRRNAVSIFLYYKKIDEDSLYMINFGVLNPTNSYPIENYGIFFSDKVASIIGTATGTGDIYNIHYNFGWNLQKSFKEDGFHKTYTDIPTLPNNIVFYYDKPNF